MALLKKFGAKPAFYMKKFAILLLTILLSFTALFTACTKTQSVSIYAPDGAPALALSSLIKEDLGGTEINVVTSTNIMGFVTGEVKKADVCILPINMAANLLGSGSDYKMVGAITHGNFYFLSRTNLEVNKSNINAMASKTVGVMQLQNVPGLTLQYALNALQVNYNIIQDTAQKQADSVNLMAINKVETARQDIDVFLIPSPQADAVEKASNLKVVGSLGALYNENGFPQAVIVVKNELLQNNLPLVKKIVSKIKTVNEFLKEENSAEICALINSKLESGLTPVFNENNLDSNSIARSKILFVSARDIKQTAQDFITNLKSVNPNSVKEFDENFFYQGEL